MLFALVGGLVLLCIVICGVGDLIYFWFTEKRLDTKR